MRRHLTEQIRHAENLGQLVDAINNWDGCDCLGCEQGFADLPTFGGEEPSDTREIWSWDRTHLMVGDATPFKLVERGA